MSVQLAPPIPDLAAGAGASAAAAAWVAAEPLGEQLAAWRHARVLEYSRELALIERFHTEVRSLRDKVRLKIARWPSAVGLPRCLRTGPRDLPAACTRVSSSFVTARLPDGPSRSPGCMHASQPSIAGTH